MVVVLIIVTLTLTIIIVIMNMIATPKNTEGGEIIYQQHCYHHRHIQIRIWNNINDEPVERKRKDSKIKIIHGLIQYRCLWVHYIIVIMVFLFRIDAVLLIQQQQQQFQRLITAVQHHQHTILLLMVTMITETTTIDYHYHHHCHLDCPTVWTRQDGEKYF